MRMSFLCVLTFSAAAGLAGCGAERTLPSERVLKVDLPADSGTPFEVRNLAGTIRVTRGEADHVEIEATVHAGSAELAAGVSLERSEGEGGAAVITVKYPLDSNRTYLYPDRERHESAWLKLLGAGSNTGLTYDGERVKVSSGSGVLLYADVEVRLPAHEVKGSVINAVGNVSGRDLTGDLRFETSSGDVTVEDLRGRITAETSSGEISASRVEGSFTASVVSGEIGLSGMTGTLVECTTVQGDIDATDLDVETVKVSTRSGSIQLLGKAARLVKAETVSGDITARADLVEEFDAGTTSGRVQLFTPGRHLRIVDVGTIHGDVELGMAAESGFDLKLEGSDPRVDMRYDDVEEIVEGGQTVGYRRGDALTKIKIDMQHGRLVVRPDEGTAQAEGG